MNTDSRLLGKANRIGLSSAILFLAGIVLSSTSRDLCINLVANEGLLSICTSVLPNVGACALIIGFLMGLIAVYFAVNSISSQ